ncbi:MAG: hypothetical protein HLUCCO02_00610 [Idiomarinaceae bacterium HL-53]|nr:MAG: hypothetical protein HLUCCO02_00610 [Idiomarinaceae bacterium HL-53]CUS48537.1 hypothetical protein Ga0003345_1495 [Idiomarinaceae bacterium HL-53]
MQWMSPFAASFWALMPAISIVTMLVISRVLQHGWQSQAKLWQKRNVR